MNYKQQSLSILMMLFFLGINAQDTTNSSIINLDVGIGGSIEGVKINTPAFYGSFEYFVDPNISVGVIGGYSTFTNDVLVSFDLFEANIEEVTTTNITAGVLGNFYVINDEKLDFYLGMSGGYGSSRTGSFYYEFHSGLRYRISDTIAINAEVGYGLSLLKTGISFNL